MDLRAGILAVALILQTGCASYFMTNGINVVPVKPAASPLVAYPNHYQEDFVYLASAAEQVVPLLDRQVPREKRKAMEQEMITTLGTSNCTYATFCICLQRYLSGINSEHAHVHYNPKPVDFTGVYPFSVHYVGNELLVSDIATNYDRSLIGQQITSINGHAVGEVEQQLFIWTAAENLFTRRKGLEPHEFSHPAMYHLLGLASSPTNNLELTFAHHAPIAIAPVFKGTTTRGYYWGRRKPNPITRRSKHLYDFKLFPDRKFAYLQFNACFDKAAIYEGIPMVKPWLRPLVRLYLLVELHRKNPGMLAPVYDPSHPYFRDFLAKAIGKINDATITNLIIDLRHNSGGEEELCTQLLYHLTDRGDLHNFHHSYYNPQMLAFSDPNTYKEVRRHYVKKFGVEPPMNTLLPSPEQELPLFNTVTDRRSAYYVPATRPVFRGRVIVLANQNTDSAAALLTSLIQDNHLATVIGTTIGNNPTGPSTFTPFKLPHSGIIVTLPSEYFERAEPANGDVFQPDIWVENSLEDLHSGRDAAFEKALELINNR